MQTKAQREYLANRKTDPKHRRRWLAKMAKAQAEKKTVTLAPFPMTGSIPEGVPLSHPLPGVRFR